MEVETDFWKQNEDAGRGYANLGNITDISYISSKRKKNLFTNLNWSWIVLKKFCNEKKSSMQR